jgi:hypothetical protein
VTRQLLGGNEGGQETISKVEPFSRDAIIEHTNQPKVFADITVRNDQHINLFSGSLAGLDNSLNEVEQRLLLAELDAPKKASPLLPTINEIEPLVIKQVAELPLDSPTPLEQTTSIFGRQVAAFEKGDLQWVQVEVPLDDLEMVAEEVRLKYPVRFYPASDGADEHEFNNVGENETDRIVEQIERSSDAEPGYWYRIFKSYDNRDDELIFYYFKTGEAEFKESESPAEPATEPMLDFEDRTSPPIPDNDLNIENAPEASEPNDEPPTSPHNADLSNGLPWSNSEPATTALLLMALMGPKANSPNRKNSAATVTDNSCDQFDHPPQKFDRRSRLQRKLKQTG